MNDWHIFRKENIPHDGIDRLPPPPPWRRFPVTEEEQARRGAEYQISDKEVDIINAALYLNRPVLISGKPGTGKSSLAYAVAYQLQLGPVLWWPITTRSTLREGIYRYDSVARLHDLSVRQAQQSQEVEEIGRYFRLGPLGTAMIPQKSPRVLLIDEIDKSDIDLPNDLLHIFETGKYEIEEIARLPKEYPVAKVRPHEEGEPVSLPHGKIQCTQFPLVIMTSNDEREFPAAFLRRCLRLTVTPPNDIEDLNSIIKAKLHDLDPVRDADPILNLIQYFLARTQEGDDLATDQLLNAVFLATRGTAAFDLEDLKRAVMQDLNEG